VEEPRLALARCPSTESGQIHGATKQPVLLQKQLQAKKVRPKASFARVAPNPECDFKLLDYDHNSVPVLYSVAVKHSSSTELLNNPPEELVFDALDAIEKGFRPHQYGWPSAIGLLGRTPNRDNPTRVFNDVDLHLHENSNKLYVATDRGLIIVAQNLSLIGLPDMQPVRFDGRIPPWAKVALKKREKRRVTHGFEAAKESQDMSLKLGSSVIVYKVDQNYEWAYGRSCDDDKKGWFPLLYTCPIN
jgi:hypothetical protein